MRALVYQLRTGQVEMVDAPGPAIRPGHVLIQTTHSLVSAGTEQSLLQFGRSGWLQKARQQPEAVRAVFQKARRDGWAATIRSVRAKLEASTPLGYCNAGVVVGVGPGVTACRVGDRVASNGAHATVVSVPQNLVATIPEHVPNEAACFTPLAAIALHGFRLSDARFGETVTVIGLGLVGMLAAQFARAAGCRVLGIDTNKEAVARARSMGFETPDDGSDAAAWIAAKTCGTGSDVVLIATSGQATAPVTLAAAAAAHRGRIVLIGTADIRLDRSLFFKKELAFSVSSSYGPGRYDPAYESGGQDYPRGYVRWTAGRNFGAVLAAMASGTLQTSPLTGKLVPFADAIASYDSASFGATIFRYDAEVANRIIVPVAHSVSPSNSKTGNGIALIGAGAFAQQIILPQLKKAGIVVDVVVSTNGLSAALAAKQFGIGTVASDSGSVLENHDIKAVIIATRHDSHAALTTVALEAGKDVFVEKPLALTQDELSRVEDAYQTSGCRLTVGFNRRYAPLGLAMRDWWLDGIPGHIVYTVNAGKLPAAHWTIDPATGGGRILGEACHFIDFCAFVSGAPVTAVAGMSVPGDASSASILLQLAGGSTAVVNYFTNGSARYPKERIEVHQAGQSAVLDNWRSLETWGPKGNRRQRAAQDKGHGALLRAALTGTRDAIPAKALFNSTRATLAAWESIRNGGTVTL